VHRTGCALSRRWRIHQRKIKMVAEWWEGMLLGMELGHPSPPHGCIPILTGMGCHHLPLGRFRYLATMLSVLVCALKGNATIQLDWCG